MFKINIRLLAVFFIMLGIPMTAIAAGAGRVTVQGTQFRLDGNQVYMNGANTPWDNWDDFGSLDWRTYDGAWWDAEFARMKAKGINSTRVWISCSGDALPFIDANGYVTGVNQQFWNDLDHYMGLASKYQVYVMASMISFDHVKNSYTNHLRWRAMLSTQDRVQAMVDNYILPFVVRYKDNPYLYAIDLCNEPEWMNENADSGNIPISQIQRYAAMSSAAIHKSGSEVLVTIGSACVKWHSAIYDANYWNDASLQAQYADADAFLDFYQIHYYLWMEPWYPLLRPPADHGINDRPLVVGEMPATDSSIVFPAGLTMAQAFESFFSTGYGGHYPWTTNGVDYQGSLSDFGNAALALQQAHSEVRSGPSGYLVIYNANEAIGGAAPAAQAKAPNVAITLAANSGGLDKTGFYFGGWNTEMNGSGTDFAAGANYTTNGSVTLYAKWTTTPPSTSTYTVTYNANSANSGAAPTNQIKTAGVDLTLATNSMNLARIGYSFAGWNTTSDGSGTDYAAGATYTTDANLTLYAKWTTVPTYTVTYNANSPTTGSAPGEQIKTEGVNLILATNSGDLAKTGYAFVGWNTAVDGSGTDYAAGAIYTTDANLTLYAKWTVVPTYTVSYNANTATSGSAPENQTKTGSVNLTLAANSGSLAKTGYSFAGWNTTADGTGTNYTSGGTYTTDANLTLYAKWTATVISSNPGRIVVQGTQFSLEGNQVYMNGANTPWHTWDDFGSLDWRNYDRAWWDAEFARMKAKGINSTRVWISCSGDALPFIDANGYVTGVNQQFWNDLDHYMGLASKHQVYVMASMMSFDHVKNSYTNYLRWRAMFSTQDRVQAMVDNYILPFVVRYKDNPYLYAIDLCNEPEWMNENADSGNIPISQIQRYAAMSAAAIHKSGSEVLVTIGSACIKWNSAIYDANYWGNSSLQAQYADADAFMDFYQVHYYLWMEPWFPLLRSPADHGITDRPLVIGEMPATDASNVFPAGLTMAQALESFFSTGYGGHYPWTTNGVDYQGSLADFGDAALALQQAHTEVRSGPVGYLVIYNANEATGGAAPAAQAKTQDVDITLADNIGGLAQTGYYFGGWNTEMDGSGTDYTAGTSYGANASVTLFAKWTTSPPSTSSYTVSYDANSATSGSAPANQTKTQDIALILASNSGNLAKTGSTFAGWNTTSDGSGTDYGVGSDYTANANVTLYAKWTPLTYTVSYDANEATGGLAPDNQTKAYDETILLSANTGGLARSGYIFTGWNTAADDSGTFYPVNSTYAVNADLVLYASWEVTSTPYIIVSPAIGNTTESGGTVTFSVALSQAPTEGAIVLVPIASTDLSEATTSVNSLLFTTSNWDTPQTVTVTGADDDLDDGDIGYEITIGPTESDDTALNGLYPTPLTITNEDDDIASIYTVSYMANGATSGTAPTDQTQSIGVEVTLAINSGSLEKTGYIFAGWNTAADGSGTDYAVGADYTADSNLTLYAKWALQNYTVTYNTNGATEGTAPADQTKTYGVSLALATNSGSLAKTGYIFAGWNTAANGSGTDYDAGADYAADADLTLYAKWVPMAYTVSYDANGATGGSAPANQTKTHGVTLTLATNSGSLVKTGYTFARWNTAASGTGTDYDAGATYTGNADLTLYANWAVENAPSIIVTPRPGFTTEEGNTVTFTVSLSQAPSDTVHVPITSEDQTEGLTSVAGLYFTPANWNSPQTVTVTGVDDDLSDGNVTYNIDIGPADSNDADYDGLDPQDLYIINMDDEGINVPPIDSGGCAMNGSRGMSTNWLPLVIMLLLLSVLPSKGYLEKQTSNR